MAVTISESTDPDIPPSSGDSEGNESVRNDDTDIEEHNHYLPSISMSFVDGIH